MFFFVFFSYLIVEANIYLIYVFLEKKIKHKNISTDFGLFIAIIRFDVSFKL